MKAIVVAGIVWVGAMLIGFRMLTAYAFTPGLSEPAPATWPAESAIPRVAGRPALLVFLHPRCPCSRASLGELSLLIAHGAARAEVRAIFLDPAGMDAAWGETDLWRAAAAMPGVTPLRDREGREARLFHSTTSGAALFYDADGWLRFQGGITASRGHAGDNPGRAAIEALLRGAASPAGAMPVFGCPLFSCSQSERKCP